MKSETFLSHLEAFRRMIIEVLAIFVILLIPAWYFSPAVLDWMQIAAQHAAKRSGMEFHLSYFSLMEPFMIELKCGMLLAFAAGLPLYFWRIWAFLAPALYRHEKKVILPGALAAWGLFGAGFAMGLLGVMPLLVKFSLSFARDGLTPVIGLGNFISMAVTVSLAFGLMFELPLLLLVLAAAGIVPLETLRRQRPLVVIIILFLAALLTPPDVISQLLLGVPTYLLFELMLLCGNWLLRKKNDSEPDPDGDADENASGVGATEGVSAAAADDTPAADGRSDYMDKCYYRPRRRRKTPKRNKNGKGYMSNG